MKIDQNLPKPRMPKFYPKSLVFGSKMGHFFEKKNPRFWGKDQNVVLFARPRGFTIKNPFWLCFAKHEETGNRSFPHFYCETFSTLDYFFLSFFGRFWSSLRSPPNLVHWVPFWEQNWGCAFRPSLMPLVRWFRRFSGVFLTFCPRFFIFEAFVVFVPGFFRRGSTVRPKLGAV